mgnify:CR=1 FL=1
MSAIKLFVGLGNPGDKYSSTRHNAGFWWIDFVTKNHKLSLKKSTKFYGYFTSISDIKTLGTDIPHQKGHGENLRNTPELADAFTCLLYTSDAADE